MSSVPPAWLYALEKRANEIISQLGVTWEEVVRTVSKYSAENEKGKSAVDLALQSGQEADNKSIENSGPHQIDCTCSQCTHFIAELRCVGSKYEDAHD